MTRLISQITKRQFETDVLTAQLQQVAIGRALATAFSSEDSPSQPAWPTWEEVKIKRQPKDLGPMGRFHDRALE